MTTLARGIFRSGSSWACAAGAKVRARRDTARGSIFGLGKAIVSTADAPGGCYSGMLAGIGNVRTIFSGILFRVGVCLLMRILSMSVVCLPLVLLICWAFIGFVFVIFIFIFYLFATIYFFSNPYYATISQPHYPHRYYTNQVSHADYTY